MINQICSAGNLWQRQNFSFAGQITALQGQSLSKQSDVTNDVTNVRVACLDDEEELL